MEQKQAIWCLKRMSLNINLLFIELLYKISITFVIMLIFEEKNGTLRVIFFFFFFFFFYYMKLYKCIHFLPHILNFVIFLNAFE